MWFLVLRFSSTASLLQISSFGRSKCSSRHAETKKMFDIKDIAPADNSIGDWWKYMLIVALILGIGVLIYWFIKTSRKKLHQEIYKTPIEKATSLLDTLEKLWQKVKSKPISELTDMQKLY
jgi:hypothetical protein